MLSSAVEQAPTGGGKCDEKLAYACDKHHIRLDTSRTRLTKAPVLCYNKR